MNFRRGLLSTSFIALLFLLPACSENAKKGAIDTNGGAATGNPLSTVGFLSTDYAPIVKWLDERFEVDYKHMTPQLIFDQVPLNDIYYETSNLPANAAAFTFSSKDISRRELLKRISHHWKLRMSFATDASGKPTAVRVEG